MKSPFPKSTYRKNAGVYKILASPKRLEILNLLRRKELSLDQIMVSVGASKANISQHLSILRHAGLVDTRRNGQKAYYKIVDPRIIEPCGVLHRMRIRKEI